MFIDEPVGTYSVMVAAINSAGVGQVGMPTIDRKACLSNVRYMQPSTVIH